MDLTKIVNNFVEQSDCQAIISRLESLISSGDVIVREDGRVGILNKEDEVFAPIVEKYKNKVINLFNNEFIHFSGYIATKYVPGVGMVIHTDSDVGEEMGALMYLNDDYEGGELIYKDPDENLKTIKPKAGDMIYSPSWYPHGVKRVISGNRYFFTVSFKNHPL